MIRILQWGSARSICKVYDKTPDNQYTQPKLMILNNDYIHDLEYHHNVSVILNQTMNGR